METNNNKRGILSTMLAAFMAILVTTAVITTASGCVVCRDCGPNRQYRR
jgi:hypothetical protein